MSWLDILLKIADVIPGLRCLVNRIASNSLSSSTTPRSNSFSLWSPKAEQPEAGSSQFLTWHTISDKQYFDLHLQPMDDTYIQQLPSNEPTDVHPFGEVTALFKRKDKQMVKGRSTVFFMFFAQWFTDGFFRSAAHDGRKTTTNHNIDLAQIYGASEEVSYMLRAGEGGKLSSQKINGEEYPDYLGEVAEDGTWQVKPKYQNLPYVKDKVQWEKIFGHLDESQRKHLFATGLERSNAIVGHISFNTLFLREHNSICEELATRNPEWGDEQLFHTARMINNVILMKLVVEEYVNHISGLDLLRVDPNFAEKQCWYRGPWIAGEFNLLYRWHSLIPDLFDMAGQHESFTQNYDLLETKGLSAIFAAASQQQAGKIGLHNSPDFMLPVEKLTVSKGRDWRLRPYNDYREAFKMDKLTSFEDFTPDIQLQASLKQLYGTPDNVELTVGLFAESSQGRRLTGNLMTRMVAYDALTQIYTNPLLSKRIFTAEHYTPYGMARIESTKRFQDLIDRNTADAPPVTFVFES